MLNNSVAQTVEELAKDLHEIDRTEGESTGDWFGTSWNDLPEVNRRLFVIKAQREIDSANFVLGEGWTDE